MRLKRSNASAQWVVDPDHPSGTEVPVGAVLATEPVFQQIAHDAQVSLLLGRPFRAASPRASE